MAELRTGLSFRAAGPLAPLQRAALWLTELAGWRRYTCALLLGALAAAALAPIDMTPLLVVSFGGLVWLTDGSISRRDAFMVGWSFGFGFFVAGLYWIGVALTVDIGEFWWLMPFVVLGVPGGLALFPAFAVLVAFEATRRLGLAGSARILVLAVAWAIAEWLRGHILTGFPWNLIGYSWAGGFPGSLAVLQAAAVIGIYGLSLVTVAAAALPARLGDSGSGRYWAPFAAVLAIATLAGLGAWRLAHAPKGDVVPGITVRLVQPSIPQTLKNDPEALRQNFERLLRLSASADADKVRAIIWPEAAAPPLLERYPPGSAVRTAIAAIVPRGGLLITGAERAEPVEGWPPRRVFNSIDVIDDKGDIIATYDKAHLVPFGEYVPLQDILPMTQVAPSLGRGFDPGPGPRTLDLPGLPPVSPLICYEAIFPGAVIDPAHRPQWLLNITNDAWYGVTSGPFQHLDIARVRAVEEGLPLIRDGNNGISAVFDAYGRLPSRLDLDAVGIRDVTLPRAAAPTPYERFRDGGFFAIALSLLAGALIVSRIHGPAPRLR